MRTSGFSKLAVWTCAAARAPRTASVELASGAGRDCPHAARPQASTSTLTQLRYTRPRDSGFCMFFILVQPLNAVEQRTGSDLRAVWVYILHNFVQLLFSTRICRSLPACLPLKHPYALASGKSRVGDRGSILDPSPATALSTISAVRISPLICGRFASSQPWSWQCASTEQLGGIRPAKFTWAKSVTYASLRSVTMSRVAHSRQQGF